MNNGLAPIILFAYNRPQHTIKTLEALMLNVLASESTLFIYCDGAKENATEEQKANISEVRNVIRTKKWCKVVHCIESDKNKGLANSVITGVSEVVEKYGKVIVLEDDLVTSKYFLKYMNDALDYYQLKKSVFSISADRPPYKYFQIPKDYQYDVFVSLRSFSTGWATWADRWFMIDWSLDYLEQLLKMPNQIEAFNKGGEDLINMLIQQRENRIDSWAIRFTYAHFVNHSIAILPCVSYIDNIGFDGSGIHSGAFEDDFRKDTSMVNQNPRFLNVLYEDKRIINAFYSAYYPKKRPLWQKIINRISRMLGGENVFVIKKKVYC